MITTISTIAFIWLAASFLAVAAYHCFYSNDDNEP